MGFEPMVQKKLHVDLANQCLRPLSHFSIFFTFSIKKAQYKTTKQIKKKESFLFVIAHVILSVKELIIL